MGAGLLRDAGKNRVTRRNGRDRASQTGKLSSLKERSRVKGDFGGVLLPAGVRDWRLLFP